MTETNCGDFEALIALEVAGDLPAAEAAPVQRHLNECEACRSFAAEMAADLQWLQAAHQEPLDSAALHQVRVGVMRRLESEQSRWDRPFGGFTAFGWRWQWVAAAVVIAIVGSVAWWGVPTSPRPPAVAVHSGNQNPQRPENVAPPSIRKAELDLKASEGAVAPTERESPVVASLPPASAAADGGAARRDVEDQRAQRPARQKAASAPLLAGQDLAGHDLAAEASSGVRQPRNTSLATGTQAEIVTAVLSKPLEEPAEVVMLKIPTSNPNIVVYWVMDEEKQPQTGVHNQGD
ncbi:MAG: zf-HC2 domain-containing protein [Bryobacterales bacterium]